MSMHSLIATSQQILIFACLFCKVETRTNSSFTFNTTLLINNNNNTTQTETELLRNTAMIGLSIWGGSILIVISAFVVGIFKLGCFDAKQDDEYPVYLAVSLDSGEDNIVYDR